MCAVHKPQVFKVSMTFTLGMLLGDKAKKQISDNGVSANSKYAHTTHQNVLRPNTDRSPILVSLCQLYNFQTSTLLTIYLENKVCCFIPW